LLNSSQLHSYLPSIHVSLHQGPLKTTNSLSSFLEFPFFYFASPLFISLSPCLDSNPQLQSEVPQK
jgi:hypothetical protein